jgi:hypothetical protein
MKSYHKVQNDGFSATQFYHLSSNRKPGVVLRVSRIASIRSLQPNLTYLFVLVAMADMRCIEFSTVISAFKIDCRTSKHENDVAIHC